MTGKSSEKWLGRFLDVADQVASWSKEPEGGTGCVLVSPDGTQVCWGYNGIPRHIQHEELLSENERRSLVLHAETNALLNSHRDLTGWAAAVTRFPCFPCATCLVQAGIRHLAVSRPIKAGGRWEQSQNRAYGVLVMADVKMWVRDKTGILLPMAE